MWIWELDGNDLCTPSQRSRLTLNRLGIEKRREFHHLLLIDFLLIIAKDIFLVMLCIFLPLFKVLRCVVAKSWNRESSGISAVMLWYQCCNAPAPVLYCFGINVVLLWHQCYTALVSVLYSSGISVVLLYHQCCTAPVSLLYYSGISLVLLWYQCCISLESMFYCPGISFVLLWYQCCYALASVLCSSVTSIMPPVSI